MGFMGPPGGADVSIGPVKERDRARKILDRLEEEMPDARIELDFGTDL
jgi:hypothetical protein